MSSQSQSQSQFVIIKRCFFCRHFDWSQFNYEYYSSLTGGELFGGMTCNMLEFAGENPCNEAELQALIRRAETCTLYEVALEKVS